MLSDRQILLTVRDANKRSRYNTHKECVFTTMYQRINITLPSETLELLDRIAPKGDRSHLIDLAVKYYINAEAKKNLREKLKHGALRWADRDLGLV